MHLAPRNSWRPFRLPAVSVAVVVALVTAACGSSSSSPSGAGGTSAAPGAGPWNIAYLAQGTTNSFAAQLDAIVKKTAADSGVVKNLSYYDAAGDANKQLGQLQTVLSQKPDAIILTPLGKAEDTGPVERAAAAGIPVILCASSVNTDKYSSLVAPDTYNAALPVAQWLVNTKLNGHGNIAVIDGIAGNDTSEQFGKAIRDAVAAAPGVKIVQQGYGSFSVSKSKQLAQTFLSSGQQIDGWWGSGGEDAGGIMSALADAKVTPAPPVAGSAATNGTLRLAKENNIPVGMVQFPATLGKNCVDTALSVLKGESVPKFVSVTALPGNQDLYTADIDKFYNPKYTDDYQTGSDQVLSQTELQSLNLLK
jgi:ribose transport system substrate-binding protein